MTTLRAHFDGKAIVLDEPVDLQTGERLTILREEAATSAEGPKAGSAKGKVWMAPDFDAPLEDFKEYME